MSTQGTDVVYGPQDLAYGPAAGAGGFHAVQNAQALFAVEISRHALRPHAKAICDAKDPDSSDVQLLMLLMHLVNNVGICNVAGPEIEASAYFEHASLGKMRRIDVFYEHVIDPEQRFTTAVRYTFAVNDPTCDIGVGITEVIRRNIDDAKMAEKRTKRRVSRPEDEVQENHPWQAFRKFMSVHDVAQAIDTQLKTGPVCIDDEAMLLGTALNDHGNPANPQQALGYAKRYPCSAGIVARHWQNAADGLHNLAWDAPYHQNVCHIAHKFTKPEIFFALPFCSVWYARDAPRVAPAPAARLEATARLRSRAEWHWKEFTDTEHLLHEIKQHVANKPVTDDLRKECEAKFWEVMNSRASRLPLVVKTILDAAAVHDVGVNAAPVPSVSGTGAAAVSLHGIDDFGRWFIGKFDDVYEAGGIVAHLREFMRTDLVAFASLRRARSVLAPFIISRGEKGSGKSKQRDEALRRHRNGKKCGYQSAKSRFVHDRDREEEVYFPLDGWWESYDEAPKHLTNERSGGPGNEKEENSVEKEMMSSGLVHWEVLGQWGAGVKRKTSRGTVSCYIGRTMNSNKRMNMTASMASRLRLQEYLGDNIKMIRRIVGTTEDKEYAARRDAWYQGGHVAERLITLAHEFIRANPHDRDVDLTVAAQVADNFFEALEEATGQVATARDKELYLMYCYTMTLWYHCERSSAQGGGALRNADGSVVQWICTEAIAVAVLSLMDMTYYYHMDSKLAVAFADAAHAAAKDTGYRPAKRTKTNKTNYRQTTINDMDPGAYLHPRSFNGCEDERYAIIPGMSMTKLAHVTKEYLHCSVEQTGDALARIRTLQCRDHINGEQVRALKAESHLNGNTASVAMCIGFIQKGRKDLARPHQHMKDVLQKVLSYPSQKARRYVTAWTLQGTNAKAPLAGAQLLEMLSVGPGEREMRVATSATAQGDTPVNVLGHGWTLDEMAHYRYAKRHGLPRVAPPQPATGACHYPGKRMATLVEQACAARGTGSQLRARGFVVDAPASFGGAAAPVAMDTVA